MTPLRGTIVLIGLLMLLHEQFFCLVEAQNSSVFPSWCTYLQGEARITVVPGLNATAACCTRFGFCRNGILTNLSWAATFPRIFPRDLHLQLPDIRSLRFVVVDQPFPPEWGNLTKVDTLFVGANFNGGSIPESWATLGAEAVSGLSIEFIAVTFNLPGATLPPVMSPHLTSFKIAARLSGTIPDAWATQSPKLRAFDVSCLNPAGLGALPVSWAALPMERFILRGCMSSGDFPAEYAAWAPTLQVLIVGPSDQSVQIATLPHWLPTSPTLTRLSLSGFGITGTISPDWGRSPCREISLAGNKLNGTLPPELGNMNLTLFDVKANQLEGNIPSEYGRWTSIRELNLAGNKLSGTIPSFSWNPALFTLDVSENRLQGTLPFEWPEYFPGLVNLRLNQNNLTGPLPGTWANFSNLYLAELSRNHFSGTLPSFISPMNNLTGLPRLVHLKLGDNDFEGSIPDSWANLTVLETLELPNNLLSGVIPARMGEPRRNPVTNVTLPARLSINLNLNNMKQICDNSSAWYLKRLELAFNGLTAVPECLYRQHVETLDLRGNELTSYNFSAMAATNITVGLDLAANQLSGRLPWSSELGRKLTTLNLGNNRYSGNASALYAFTNLCVLALNDNKLEGELNAQNMALLSSVYRLDLSGNTWTGAEGQPIPVASLQAGRSSACKDIFGGVFRHYDVRSRVAFSGLSQVNPPADVRFQRNPFVATQPMSVNFGSVTGVNTSCSVVCKPTSAWFPKTPLWDNDLQAVTNLALVLYASTEFSCDCESFVTLLANGISASVSMDSDPPIEGISPRTQLLAPSLSGVFSVDNLAVPLLYDVSYRIQATVFLTLENYLAKVPPPLTVFATSKEVRRRECSERSLLAVPGTTLCLACPEEALCNGTSIMTTTRPLWRPNGSYVTFRTCTLRGCDYLGVPRTGWECAPGYHGLLCDSCRAGYQLLGKECIKCMSSAAANWVIMSLVMLGTIVFNAVMILLECRSQGKKLAAEALEEQEMLLDTEQEAQEKAVLAHGDGQGDATGGATPKQNPEMNLSKENEPSTALEADTQLTSVVLDAEDHRVTEPVEEPADGASTSVPLNVKETSELTLEPTSELSPRSPSSPASPYPRHPARASDSQKRILLCIKMLQNHIAVLSFFLSSPLFTDLLNVPGLNVNWFRTVVTIASQATTLDQMQVFLGCAIKQGPVGRMYFVAPQVTIMVLFASLLVLGIRLIKKVGIRKLHIGRVLRITLTILMLSTSLALISAGAQPLACDTQTFFTAPPASIETSYRTLSVDRTVNCDDPSYAGPLAVAWLLNIFAIVIVPLVLATVFYRTQLAVGLEATRAQYEFMTGNFLEKFWYWELLIFTRKNVCMLLATLVVSKLGLIASLFIVLLLSLLAHFLAMPYNDSIYNRYDVVSLTSCGLLGSLIVVGTQIEGMALPAFVLIVIVTFASLLPMLLVIGWSIVEAVRRRMKDQEEDDAGEGMTMLNAAAAVNVLTTAAAQQM